MSYTLPWIVFRKDTKKLFYNKDDQSTQLTPPAAYLEWRAKKVDEHLEKNNSRWRRSEKDGKSYYYDRETRKSQWSDPDIVKEFDQQIESLTRDFDAHLNTVSIPSDFSEWMIRQVNLYLETLGSDWRCVKHKDGRNYYYDKTTRVAQWNQPEGVKEFESFLIDVYVELSDKFDHHSSDSTKTKTPPTISDLNQDEAFDKEFFEVPTGIASSNKQFVGEDQDDDKYLDYDDNYEYENINVEDNCDHSQSVTPEIESKNELNEEYHTEGTLFVQDREKGEEERYDWEDDTTPVHQQQNEDMHYEEANESASFNDNSDEVGNVLVNTFSKIDETDSILNIDIINELKVVLSRSTESPINVIYRLSGSYVGYPKMARILVEFINLLQSMDKDSFIKKEDQDSSYLNTDEVISSAIADIIKQRYDKRIGDELLLRLTDLPFWLNNMIDDEVFRKMLIEMFDLHRGSSFLGVCLREISARGHFSEISKLLKDVEYFEVFNNMVIDIIIKIVQSTAPELDVLLSDFKRLCCSSEYMFLYTFEILKVIITRTDSVTDDIMISAGENIGRDSINLKKILICRKLKRLSQELENEVIWSSRDSVSGRLNSSAILAFKMITTSEGSQIEANIQKEVNGMFRSNSVYDDTIEKLYNTYFGSTLIDSKDELLHPGRIEKCLSNIALIGNIQHHCILDLLVDRYVSPVKQLSSSIQLGLVILLSLSCSGITASSQSVINNSGKHEVVQRVIDLCQKLLQAKELWLEISKLAYGVLSYEKALALGEQMKESIVSVCVLRWIRICVHDNQFNSKAAFLFLLPMFFHLVVQAATFHPFQIPECFDILKDVMSLSSTTNSNYEITKTSTDVYTLVSAQKDVIEILVYFIGLGYTIPTLQYLASKVEEWDAVTLRHILTCLLSSMAPPYSSIFVDNVLLLLCKPSVQKAASSTHFIGREMLSRFLEEYN